MIPVPLWMLLAGVLVASLGAGGSYIKGRADGVALEKGRHAEQTVLIAQVAEQAALGTAAEIAQIEITHQTIVQPVQRTIRETPVYRDCQHPAHVLRAINAALAGAEPAAGDRELPQPDPAR